MNDATSDDIDLQTLWGSLKRGLPRLVVWSVAASAICYGALTLVAPRYESEAQIAIVAKGSANPFQDSASGGAPEAVNVRMDKEAVNTHVRALQSPDLAAKIATEQRLADMVEFNAALGSADTMGSILRLAGIGEPRAGETEQDRVLSSYFKRLDVYPAKDSRIIGIKFWSSDPELAAAIPNSVAEAYRGSIAARQLTENDDLQKALEPKLAELVNEVSAADAEVERFRAQADIFKSGRQASGLNEQQLGELTAELSRVQAARSEAEARASSARDLMKQGTADALPDVQKSPIIQALNQQRIRLQRQISELSATLLPGHPRMRQLSADLAGLKAQINSEVGKVVQSLDKEAKVAASREASITKSVDSVKARIVTTGPDEVKLRQLESTSRAKRAELDRLQAQYESNRGRAETRVVPVEVQFVTRARASSVPVFPKKSAFAGLAGMAVFLLGLALLITRGLFVGVRRAAPRTSASRATSEPNSVPSPLPSAEPAARIESCLAAVVEALSNEPMRLENRTPQPEAYQENPADLAPPVPAFPSVSAVVAHLAARHRGPAGFRTLIAGADPSVVLGEETIEFVKEMSKLSPSTLLIDWSGSGEGVLQLLGVQAEPGMMDMLEGRSSFEDIVKRMPGSDAHLITCGAPIGDESSALEPDQLNIVLDALDEAYEHIIVCGSFDAASVLFETLQGRFDAGVTIRDAVPSRHRAVEPAGMFLGFEVTDIELVSYERSYSGLDMGEDRVPAADSSPAPIDAAPQPRTNLPAAAAGDTTGPTTRAASGGVLGQRLAKAAAGRSHASLSA